MTAKSLLHLGLALAVAGAIGSAVAQDAAPAQGDAGHNQAGASSEQQDIEGSVLRLLPADSTTQHSIDTGHGKLAYAATAGTLPFYNLSGKRSATVFYTAYVAKDAGENRPLTFVFNGGPGAASAFLHLGIAGPRLLDLGPGGRDAARAELRDNPDTWLRFTDLVFIDPIGTGWSRTLRPDDTKKFWGVQSDAEAMAKVIALYVDHNDRSPSPKYLFGESYGGFRAAKVARALQSQQGIQITGIVMLSPLLEGTLTFGDNSSALRAALQLPSLAAAELERKHAFTREALAPAEKFAMTKYLVTLAGAPPKGVTARAFYRRIADLTGLAPDVVTQARGFVANTYVKSLRASDRKIVSPYDATFAVDDPYPELRSSRGTDPILDGISRAYGGAMASYARNELGFKTDITYVLLALDAARQWDWQGSRSLISAEDDLRVLFAFDPSFRLLIAHGYSDMVTPYAMTRYILDHLPASDLSERAQLKLYRGGHMIYLDPQSRKAFSDDAAAFFAAANKATR
jgi:carboxypeptidase C (cathepsin A)